MLTSAGNLIWLPEKGIGYFPVADFVYDQSYFDKYQAYAKTEIGVQLNLTRAAFVKSHYAGEVVDIGIGSGQFIRTHGQAKGYDVNPAGKAWLETKQLWHDVYAGEICEALTFWDSLEHIKNIEAVVRRASKFVFTSLPIFKDCEHILRSKHYRKDEHYWYFTHDGIINWFGEQGFELIGSAGFEQDFGREDIWTYAFRRKNA